ncbi:hypothetical protein IB238_09280 [Rhizobium sp. ARZ01]|uniref:hypothetical protein n=1 Tax=Rhizobium sp. ARZ01 TaxID=2769313 RepID=UPI001785C2F8|nr:hypothetical protein [Rhizobium sp. ARZ01]MBD9372810.1 hypothetical protein [Rhizobium sp. ARZ01]
MSTTSSAAVIGILVLGVAAGVASYMIQTHIEQSEISVVSKERLLSVSTDSDGKSSSKYRNFVYSDAETYVVEDSLWNGHFTSSTVYAKIQEGARCRVTLAGYRFGFLSMFQNIIEVECGA